MRIFKILLPGTLIALSIFILLRAIAMPARSTAFTYGRTSSEAPSAKEAPSSPEVSNSGPVQKTSEGMEKQDVQTPLIMSFMGDVLLDSHVSDVIYKKGPTYLLSDVAEVLQGSHFNMVNLENPFSTGGIKAENKQYTFRANPGHLEALSSGKINAVTLANNHILDFGIEALLDTMKYLKAKNILFTGAGTDFEQANSPIHATVNGVRLAVLGSSHVLPFVSWHAGSAKPGVASTYNPAKLLSEISDAEGKADLTIVYVHWGEEMKTEPLDYQKNLARMYIDKGADIVIGSHPHVLQGFEYYKGKLIAYSLGNFVFTNTRRDTIILNMKYDTGNGLDARIIPCEIIDFRPVLVQDPAKHQQILDGLRKLSPDVKIDKEGNVRP